MRYTMLISEARQMVEETKIPEALHLNRKALKILYSDKLERKIQRMEVYYYEMNYQNVILVRSQNLFNENTKMYMYISVVHPTE